MPKVFIKITCLSVLLAALFLSHFALAGPCPPQCNQPSSQTNAANNTILNQLSSDLSQLNAIDNQISQYPNGQAPSALTQEAAYLQADIQAKSGGFQTSATVNKISKLSDVLTKLNAQIALYPPGQVPLDLQNQAQDLQKQITQLSDQGMQNGQGSGGSNGAATNDVYSLLGQLNTIQTQIGYYPQSPPPQLTAQALNLQQQIVAVGGSQNIAGSGNQLVAQLYPLLDKWSALNVQLAQYGSNPPPALIQQAQQLQAQINTLSSQLSTLTGGDNSTVTQVYNLLNQETAVSNQMSQYAPGPVPVALTQQAEQIQQQIQVLGSKNGY